MAHTKQQQVAFVRLIFKLLIFVAIIQQNYGHMTSPLTTVAAVAVDKVAFQIELSSPVPFTTHKPEISAKSVIESLIPQTHQDTAKGEDKSSSSSNSLSTSGSSSSTLKTIETNLKNLNYDESLPSIGNNNDENNNNSYDDYIETEFKMEKTTPTSMEQQDDPVIPPTTITFSNVAAAGILSDSNSNMDSTITRSAGYGNANEGSENFPSDSINNFNDATPPYAAVDEKYGKLIPINF